MNKYGLVKGVVVVSLSLFASACSKSPEAVMPRVSVEPTKPKSVLARDVLSFADASKRDLGQKKYFLIAGSADNANFAQEIMEQKRYLLKKGVPESEIACFYAIPSDESFIDDQTQYVALAPELKNCFPAAPKLIWEVMADGNVKRDFVYVYASSHGSKPLRTQLTDARVSANEKQAILSWLQAFPSLDQFFISTDTTAAGVTTSLGDELPKLQAEGLKVDDLLFSPQHLRDNLEFVAVAGAKKYVVIQACYSGGFIQSETPIYDDQAIRHLENVSVMTAARPDRTSFGCNPGVARTNFGGAFTDALVTSDKLPQDLEWGTTYTSIATQMEKMENDIRQQMSREDAAEFKPSQPLYFTNIP